MADYLYRGNETDPFVAELEGGAIQGAFHNIYKGELAVMPDEPPIREPLGSLEWMTLDQERVGVTGGVTDALVQTKRFSDGNNYAMVLDANAVPFEPVQYDYDWYNENPGVLDHILSSAAGEIRLTGRQYPPQGQLYGAVKKKVMMNRDDYLEIREWGTGSDLPAVGQRSGFADEAEWVAMQEEVNISGAIEGVVAWKDPLGIRVKYSQGKDMIPKDAPRYDKILPEVYEEMREPLPPWTRFYLLVAETRDATPGGAFRPGGIKAAYRDDGEVEPEQVPAPFRGEA